MIYAEKCFTFYKFHADEVTVQDRTPTIPVCDYEGSDYQTRFWENKGRDYEDLVERIAIRHLLPGQGKRLLEIGAGFGRLADLYQGYEQIVLLDYSKSLLQQAKKRLGGQKHIYIAANVYQLPLAADQFNAVCMVRVIHHLVDIPLALSQIDRVLGPGGVFLLEFANKCNLKAIMRRTLRLQTWSPFDLEPIEFAPLNFDFHPRWMRTQLEKQGFAIRRMRTLSHFRLALLKRLVPARILSALDGLFQPSGQWWQFTPSVMMLAQRKGIPQTSVPESILFLCPTCRNSNWQTTQSEMHCLSCHTRWRIDDGIYDFKTPIED